MVDRALRDAITQLELAERLLNDGAHSLAVYAGVAVNFVGFLLGASDGGTASTEISNAIQAAEVSLRLCDADNVAATQVLRRLDSFPHGRFIGPWKAERWGATVRDAIVTLRASNQSSA